MSDAPIPSEILSGPSGAESKGSGLSGDAELSSGLDVVDLHKSFGTHPVLSGLDLSVPAGSFTAILGSSGSGKTTLLRLLAGFDRPDRGVVKIGERLVDGAAIHVRPEQRRIGYVPQEGGLFPHLTVAANVGFGLSRAARRGKVNELLELVGLADLGRRYPHQLSGGQQQRVALARALAVGPEVVLLDEPFASLDAHMRASVREEVQRILQASATTTLLVTHDQDEALSLADRVAVLRDGKIAQHATPQEIYARPLDDRLARFVGEANLIAGVLDGALSPDATRQAPGAVARRDVANTLRGERADPPRADRLASSSTAKRVLPDGSCERATTGTMPSCTCRSTSRRPQSTCLCEHLERHSYPSARQSSSTSAVRCWSGPQAPRIELSESFPEIGPLMSVRCPIDKNGRL